MKNKMLWLAHMMSYCTRRIKITLTDGTEIIGKTIGIDYVDEDEEEPYYELFFAEDFTRVTHFIREEEIEDIDPVGWELD